MQPTDSGNLTAIILIALPLLIGIVALLFAILAWRGSRLDDHPLCRACGFDLVGSPEPRAKCPECGADVSRSGAIRIGNRKRRKGPAILATIVALLCVAGLGFYGYAKSSKMNFNPYKPAWLLRWEATTPGMSSGGALDELYDRARRKLLTTRQKDLLMANLLAVQADPSIPWDNTWTDLFYVLFQQNVGTAKQHERFAAEVYRVTLHARAKTRQGDSIQHSMRKTGFRGQGDSTKLYFVQNDYTVTIGNIGNAVSSQGSGFSSPGGYVSGGRDIRTDRPPFDAIPPGRHDIRVDLPLEIRVGSSSGPLIATVELQLTDTLEIIPADAEDIRIVDDPMVGQEVEGAITLRDHKVEVHRDKNDDHLNAHIEIENLPHPIAYEVVLIHEDSEWRLTTLAYPGSGGKPNTSHTFGTGGHIKGGLPDGVTVVDVVFRPSADAARKSLEVYEIVDHEFVIEGVAIERETP